MPAKTTPIVPHLWFDREAKEAAGYYVSVFPDGKIKSTTTMSDTPAGEVDIVSFSLSGQDFMAISAGPTFKVNESISFYVYCGSDGVLERLYETLSAQGTALMPLDQYPWSNKYAWVKDRFGVSWQLDVAAINSTQKIVPTLLFANEKFDKIREALSFYQGIFPDSGVLLEAPYDPSANAPEGTLLFAQFSLSGNLFNSISSTHKHEFDFNEALSFMVQCDTQEEIDYYWERLTAEGQEQPCGWVKDKYGVSWQIVPRELGEMMLTPNKEQQARVTRAVLKMMKLHVQTLRQAYQND